MPAAQPRPGRRYRLPALGARIARVTVAAAMTIVVATPVGAATSSHKCGAASNAAADIVARGVPCSTAKRFARDFRAYGKSRSTFRGYACTRTTPADKQFSWAVSCRKPGKLISWRGGPVG
jgi:hypothetical protein